MDKYEYLTGEDLGYRQGVVEKVIFYYSLLGEALYKLLKKEDKVNKVIKYRNYLVHMSEHNFSKHRLSTFNEITSIDSKFDTLNKFYKDFIKLEGVKTKSKDATRKKTTVLKMLNRFIMN